MKKGGNDSGASSQQVKALFVSVKLYLFQVPVFSKQSETIPFRNVKKLRAGTCTFLGHFYATSVLFISLHLSDSCSYLFTLSIGRFSCYQNMSPVLVTVITGCISTYREKTIHLHTFE